MRSPSTRITSRSVVAAALALSLAVLPLAACSSQATQDDDSSAAQSQTDAIDVSSWKTLGDALAYETDGNTSAGWDEQHYVTVFSAGDSFVRVVAQMDAAAYEGLDDLDLTDDDYDKKFLEVMGGLEILSAEDLTGEMLSADELDAYVGKTGQDLVDDGLVFEGYWMYGGDETGAKMDRGFLAYEVTFDVSVTEEQTEDGGAALMGATVTEMTFAGGSDASTDPSTL